MNPNDQFTGDLRKTIKAAIENKAAIQHIIFEIELAKQELVGRVIMSRNMSAMQQQAESIIESQAKG